MFCLEHAHDGTNSNCSLGCLVLHSLSTHASDTAASGAVDPLRELVAPEQPTGASHVLLHILRGDDMFLVSVSKLFSDLCGRCCGLVAFIGSGFRFVFVNPSSPSIWMFVWLCLLHLVHGPVSLATYGKFRAYHICGLLERRFDTRRRPNGYLVLFWCCEVSILRHANLLYV